MSSFIYIALFLMWGTIIIGGILWYIERVRKRKKKEERIRRREERDWELLEKEINDDD